MMQFHNARTSLNSIDNYMKMPVEHEADREFVSRPDLRGAIEFRNVSFSYPGSEQASLSGVSFSVRPGERVGIIGRIGSGKTTLEKLVLGLYQPTEGSVLIDGVDARQIDPVDLRRAIGHVPQDPMLFYGSLKHNLLVGRRSRASPICCMRRALPAWMSSWRATPRAMTCWWASVASRSLAASANPLRSPVP